MASPARAVARLLPRPLRREALQLYAEAEKQQKAHAAVHKEVLFFLQSLNKLKELNARYFPASELTEREKITRTANFVGLQTPQHHIEASDKNNGG